MHEGPPIQIQICLECVKRIERFRQTTPRGLTTFAIRPLLCAACLERYDTAAAAGVSSKKRRG
jgi:uncharacterized protein YlaI